MLPKCLVTSCVASNTESFKRGQSTLLLYNWVINYNATVLCVAKTPLTNNVLVLIEAAFQCQAVAQPQLRAPWTVAHGPRVHIDRQYAAAQCIVLQWKDTKSVIELEVWLTGLVYP